MGWTYAKAGVDLSKHREMHSIARAAVEQVAAALGGQVERFGGYAPRLVVEGKRVSLHVDGTGTKCLIAYAAGRPWVAGWDAVAMNVNDVACEGYKPVAVVDYIALEKSDVDLYRGVVEGIARACIEAKALLVGGETAILPDMVKGFDVSCTVLAVEHAPIKGRAEPGSILIGLRSSGLHANGYSLARKVLLSRYKLSDKPEWSAETLADELLKPTIIYSNLVLKLAEENLITAAAHITGGAYTKLKRITPSSVDLVVRPPKPQPIFEAIMKLGGVSLEEMYRVFNMGLGMIVAAPDKRKAEEALMIAEEQGFQALIVGEARQGQGRVVVEAPYGETLFL